MEDEKKRSAYPCDKCEYAWRYFVNGLKPCVDAYKEVAKQCGYTPDGKPEKKRQ